MTGGLEWLHGWPRMGLTGVLIGTGVHCVGCGDFHGVTCVAIDPGWEPPTQDPAWPFVKGECPVCVHGPYSHTEPVFDVAVAEIQADQEWLLEGSWVRVVRVLARGPGERVSVTYEQDGEQATTREYRGYDRAAVRAAGGPNIVEDGSRALLRARLDGPATAGASFSRSELREANLDEKGYPT